MKKLEIIVILLVSVLVGIYYLLSPKANEFKEKDLLEDIRSRGYIKVGINPNSKPFGFMDSNNKFTGYDVDLAHYIAQAILKNRDAIKIIPVTASNRLLKASTGEVDIIISTVTITPQREEIVSFSKPYDVAGQALLVRSNSYITSITDLNGDNVGVIFGTTAEKNIKTLLPNINLIGFRNYNDAYLALKSGKINAITSDDTILNRFAIDDLSVKLLPKRYSKEPYGIAFKKGNSTLKFKDELDFAIDDLKRKNVINRLRKKWGVD